MSLRIACDLDGVLADLEGAIAEAADRLFGPLPAASGPAVQEEEALPRSASRRSRGASVLGLSDFRPSNRPSSPGATASDKPLAGSETGRSLRPVPAGGDRPIQAPSPVSGQSLPGAAAPKVAAAGGALSGAGNDERTQAVIDGELAAVEAALVEAMRRPLPRITDAPDETGAPGESGSASGVGGGKSGTVEEPTAGGAVQTRFEASPATLTGGATPSAKTLGANVGSDMPFVASDPPAASQGAPASNITSSTESAAARAITGTQGAGPMLWGRLAGATGTAGRTSSEPTAARVSREIESSEAATFPADASVIGSTTPVAGAVDAGNSSDAGAHETPPQVADGKAASGAQAETVEATVVPAVRTLSDRQQSRLWHEVRSRPNFWETLNEIEPGAVARLGVLAEQLRWEVIFITQRPSTGGDTCQVQTHRWLERHGFARPSVFVIRGSRGRVATALDLDVVIDDRPENSLDVAVDSKARSILIWRGDPASPVVQNARRVGIHVYTSVADCLDALADPAWGKPTLLSRIKGLFRGPGIAD